MNDDLDAYDRFARVYDLLWAGDATARFWPLVRELVLSRLAAKASVLDLCCGTGRMCGELHDAGFGTVGVDGSRGMIGVARARRPELEFQVSRCSELRLHRQVDAALCLYDSLNHVSEAELGRTFEAVFAALRGGWFLFDLNTPRGYEARWRGSFKVVKPDAVAIGDSDYDAKEGIAQLKVTTFLLENDRWQREDLSFRQRAFAPELVTSLLTAAGFIDCRVLDAEQDLALRGGQGRLFFLCRRGAPPNEAAFSASS